MTETSENNAFSKGTSVGLNRQSPAAPSDLQGGDTDSILEVSHVSSSYRDGGLGIVSRPQSVQILHDVSFRIHKGEFFGLVGESGCGKSTLCNSILGLQPFSGTIRVNGTSRKELGRKDFSEAVQAVFQDPMSALDLRKTIGYTLREPLIAHSIGTAQEQHAAVLEMLSRIGLDASYEDRYPGELSGGQRQRICIGAALMLHPSLIIADEAVSALDVSVGAQILNLFRDTGRNENFAMLFISHNLNVVYYLCSRIAVMYSGRIVEIGSADDIYYHSVHPYTRLLLSAIPDFEHGIEEEEAKEAGSERQTQAELHKAGEAAGTDRAEKAGRSIGKGAAKGGLSGQPHTACCFYARCPYATEKCLCESPQINVAHEDAPEHLVSCILAK